MTSRAQRRAAQRKGENVSDIIEKRHTMHPMLYGGTIVVLVIVVVAFVLVGPSGPMRAGSNGQGSLVFGSYNGHDIVYYPGSYFAQQRDAIANQVKNSGNQDPVAMAQSVWYQAFLATAQHTAILDDADRAGVVVTDDAVDRALLTYPGYLDENGKFSEARYNAASSSDKATTRKLMRENMIQNIVLSDIGGGIRQGSKETDFVTSMFKSERSFSFVSWPFTSFPNDEVRKYGEANKSRFQKIKLSRILVKSSESEAQQIRRKIADKTSTFEELAKTYSKDAFADKGGDMGWRYAYDLEADFEAKDTAQKVLALKGGELSDVLKGTFGWMIYRCDSEAVDADFANPAVLDDVRKYLTTYEKGKVEDYFSNQAALLQRRAETEGLDGAARQAGLAVATIQPLPINLSNLFSLAPLRAVPDSATPTNAAYSEDFFYRAFSLGKDQVSAPIILDDQVLVLKLKSEQDMPASSAAIMSSWLAYAAGQSLQTDFGSILMNPDKLKDNFISVFSQYVMPSSSKQ
ncbi:MAG TPA: peptidyl-prolyl cis-trans isomerase [Spirochaetia bacterium]|nr:peptidyl-prolyl cis-trans isomerase [Spirochaetia bacterium]